MKITVKINQEATMARFHAKITQAQKCLDNEVLKDCAPYVPKDLGNLEKSGILGTTLGNGQVVYNAPYARKCYYGTTIIFSTAKHPQACAQWFEKAKAVNKKKWFDAVEKTVKE